MNRKIKAVITFLFCTLCLSAQETTMYRLILTDKGNSPYSIDRPGEFLSQKSIDRRTKQGFPVNETDLPIDSAYFEALIEAGASIQTHSKWVNTVVVKISDDEVLENISQLSFIDSLYKVWTGSLPEPTSVKNKEEQTSTVSFDLRTDNYGEGITQISLHNGYLLHELGYTGENIAIAVLDGGFKNANNIDYFDQSKILGVKNFTHESGSPLEGNTDHGTRVLSCMLANKQGHLIGTAPHANYYLFKTEVNNEEFPIEEDYWVAALEYADSIGVDIVSTSLGYSTFDDASMNHDQSQLDGATVPASKAASMAASKGMLLVNSAGNEGNKNWKKIMFPSDAKDILTVGSIMSDSIRSSFSSIGNTSDGRIKPDIMAMGTAATIVTSEGTIAKSNGTSFSCPIMSGLVACLWQALPELNSLELIDLIRKSADRYQDPDNQYGYGIPDVLKAYNSETSELLILSPDDTSTYLRVDTSKNHIYINKTELDCLQIRLSLFAMNGLKVFEDHNPPEQIDISHLKDGTYIAYLLCGEEKYIQKFIVHHSSF